MSSISGIGSSNSAYLLQQLTGSGNTSNTGASSILGSTAANQSSADISGPGQLLSALQQLQTTNPATLKQLANQIGAQLQAAAQQQGQSGSGGFLSSLAAQFQNVANTGDTSQLQLPEGHHGGHHHSYNAQGQVNATTQTPSATSASSTQPAGVNLQQLFANIVGDVRNAVGA